MAARVLLVEDAPDVRDLVSAALTGQGYEAVVAASGEEALELARSERIDIVCLEVDLPDIDGFVVAERLLADPITRYIPFLFVTARKSLTDRVRGLRLGAHAYLTKPFAFPELFATLEGILRRTQQQFAALGVVGLMGSLGEVGISAVLQAIEHEQRTGVLTITSGHDWGRISFVEGKLVAAESGRAHGEPAIFRMVAWRNGSYAFRPQPVEPAPPLADSCTSILVRAYQRLDEDREAARS